MKVIVSADDFGVTHGVNKAISEAYAFGTLSSASIRTNGVAYAEAVELLKSTMKGIGVGLHLNLTDGASHTSGVSNKNGDYARTFVQYYRDLKQKNSQLLKSIELELREQFEINKKSGVTVDHVDGQDHIHMIPEIFELTCELAREYSIKAIRMSHEPIFLTSSVGHLHNSIAQLGVIKNVILSSFASKNYKSLKKYGLISTSRYFGVLYTSNMDLNVFKSAITYGRKKNLSSIEIALHPGYSHYKNDHQFTSPFFKKYENSVSRDKERSTLLSESLKELLIQKNIRLSTFSDLF